jgi:hypothetical protein
LVWLAGQNELQACAALKPACCWIGKKRPSQVRTQNATPPPISAGRCASGAREPNRPNGLNWGEGAA